MLGFLKKKRNEDTKRIAEEIYRLAALKSMYYDVSCNITFNYELDEDNIVTIEGYGGKISFYELRCHMKMDYEINGKDYHVESSFVRDRNEDLNKLYLSVENDLEDGSDITLEIENHAKHVIKEKLLSERAEQMKAYINNNKDMRLVTTIQVEK